MNLERALGAQEFFHPLGGATSALALSGRRESKDKKHAFFGSVVIARNSVDAENDAIKGFFAGSEPRTAYGTTFPLKMGTVASTYSKRINRMQVRRLMVAWTS